MADGVEVKIGVDGAAAKSNMDSTASSIQDSLTRIANSLDSFGSKNQQIVREAISNNANLSRSFLELRGSATTGFNAIAGVIERFRGVLGTLAAALAGGAIFKGSIDALLRMEDAVRGLEIVFGLSASKATALAVQLKLAGISAETFEQMAMRVGMRLRVNSAEFDKLGIVTRDTTGAFLPMDQILQNIYTRMQDFKAGADQDLFALTAVGRNARDFASDMQRMSVAVGEAAEVQKRLGIEMGPDRQSQIERYRMSMNEFKLTMETIGEKVGELVLPRLQGMAEWFNSIGPGAVKVFNFTASSLISILQAVGSWAGIVAIRIGELIDAIRIRFAELAEIAAHWRDGWAAIQKIHADYTAKVVAVNRAAADAVASTWAEAVQKINNVWAGAPAPKGLPSAVPKSGKLDMPDLKAGNDLVAQWKQQLEEMQMAEGFFHEFSKADEAAFWASKLKLVAAGTKEYREVYSLMYQALKADAHEEFADSMALFSEMIAAASNNKDRQLELAHDRTQYVLDTFKTEGKEFQAALKEENKLREEWAKKDEAIVRQATKFHIDLLKDAQKEQETYLNGEVAAGRISAEQKLEIERDTEAQIYAAEMDAVNNYIATLQVGTKEYYAALQQRLTLTIDYNNKQLQLAQQLEKEREQYAKAADQAIENSLGTLIDNLVSRTKSLRQVWQDFVKQLTGDLNKIATESVMKQLMGPGTQGGQFLSGITSKIFGTGGAAQEAVQQANTTAVALLTTAIQANTIALQTSSAGGLFGGAGGTATGGGGVNSIFSLFPGFAEGTPYVPQTSLALVHRGEAIIPARYNNGSGMAMTNHTHIYLSGAVDTRTQHQISKAAADGVRRAQIRANGS